MDVECIVMSSLLFLMLVMYLFILLPHPSVWLFFKLIFSRSQLQLHLFSWCFSFFYFCFLYDQCYFYFLFTLNLICTYFPFLRQKIWLLASRLFKQYFWYKHWVQNVFPSVRHWSHPHRFWSHCISIVYWVKLHPLFRIACFSRGTSSQQYPSD